MTFHQDGSRAFSFCSLSVKKALASSLERGRSHKLAKVRASPLLFLQCQGNGKVHPGAGCLVLFHSIYSTPLQPFYPTSSALMAVLENSGDTVYWA